jgi:hypothetical protein
MTEDTATMERDLAAVEAALASGAATHQNAIARELQELALELRADAPKAEPGFAEELGARARAGFPREGRSARRRAQAAAARQQAALERLAARAARGPGALGRRLLLPIAGVGLSLLLIVVVVYAAGGLRGDGAQVSSGGREGGGNELALPEDPTRPDGGVTATARPDGGGAAIAPAQPLTSGPGFAPGQADRKIERSFSLELEVAPDEMAHVADGVTAVTNRHGGFVLNSSISSGEDGGGGDFSLRIPTDRLRPALRDLAELAPVIRQSQEGRDVTRKHVTVKDRLQAARAERRSLLRRLELATTDEEAEAIRQQLDLVAGEISGLRGQLRDLRLRTDYAVVTVSLLVDGNKDNGGSGAGGFDDAIDDAGGLLVGFAGVLIRVLALALPLGLIALAAWLGARAARRRRRESALV